jgi:hypothetical protein
MKKRLWIICLMVFVCVLSSTVVWVEEKKVDFSKEVELLIQVVSSGEAKKDPLIIISAVRMLDALPYDSITVEGSSARYEREALLNQAKEYASGDKEVLAMIAKVQEEKTTVRAPHHPHHYHHHGGYHGGYHGGGGPGCALLRPHMDN